MERDELVGLEDGVACPACGVEIERAGLRSSSDADDPLQVYECDNCSKVIDVGSHRW